ncbi:hypothetical protein [Nocardiopsis coralliicola]
MHPDLSARLAAERIADMDRAARHRRAEVDAPDGDGPGGGRPRTGLDGLRSFLSGTAEGRRERTSR